MSKSSGKYETYKDWLMYLMITYGVGQPLNKQDLIPPYYGTAFMAKHIDDADPHSHRVRGDVVLTDKAYKFLDMESRYG